MTSGFSGKDMDHLKQLLLNDQTLLRLAQMVAKVIQDKAMDIVSVKMLPDGGVPQLRKRAFVIAYHRSMGLAPQFPRRTHERVPIALEAIRANGKPRYDTSRLPFVSVEEAIGDLPRIEAGEGDEVMFYAGPPQTAYQRWAREGSVAIFNHRSRAHTQEYLDKISVIREGGRNFELPKGKRFSENYFSQAYARLHRNGIAQTVTTYFGNPGSGRFMHYSELRSITVREAARLQSFPDSFVFEGHQGSQMRHVGNAVPPLLARAIRDQLAADLRMTASRLNGERAEPAGRAETPEQRSRIMRAVPSKHTSTEKLLRKYVTKAGLRGYRLHDDSVSGTPDIVFTKARLAIFVDGCFWHGCAKCYREPKSNREYWRLKVARNRDRDERVNSQCAEAGWRVLRLWEHEVTRNPEIAISKVVRALKASKSADPRPSVRRKPRTVARSAPI